MNRTFTKTEAIEKGMVSVYARVTFGSTGAPTLDTANSKGVKSISRTSAGLYAVTLSEAVQRLMMARHIFYLSSGAPASPSMFVKTETVNSTSTPGVINIQFNAAGTATDPASGEEVRVEFVCKNSTV